MTWTQARGLAIGAITGIGMLVSAPLWQVGGSFSPLFAGVAGVLWTSFAIYVIDNFRR